MTMITRYDDINLTKEQNDCVNYNAGNLLIKGIAGAGKSLVLLKRAIKLQKETDGKIAIFTYANTLVYYTKEIIERQKISEDRIEISTLDSYCTSLYRRMSNKSISFLDDKTRKAIIKEVIKNHQIKTRLNHRFYKINEDFWCEEFSWIKGKNIRTEEEYINSDRTGRGCKIRMSANDKRFAYSMYKDYITLVAQKGKVELEDLYRYILDNKYKIPNDKKIDYVLIDEAQDLPLIKLLVVKEITTKALTIAADHAQKIYKNSFTWKELGINFQGRASKQLNKTFRSTKQIILLANEVLKQNKSPLTNDYIKPMIPEAEGSKPQIINCKNELTRKNCLCNILKNLLKKSDATIGILYRKYNEGLMYKSWMQEENIDYEYFDKEKPWSLLKPGVKITTFHSAKGLEFDIVIIPKIDDENIPKTALAYTEKDEIEEVLESERSLLYVGMTRARNRLLMFTQSGQISRFFKNISKEFYDVHDIS